MFLLGLFFYLKQQPPQEPPDNKTLQELQKKVDLLFRVNSEALFKENVTFEGDIIIDGRVVVNGSISSGGSELNAGDVTIINENNAGLIISGLTSGTGISVTTSSSPTINNTGVLSLQSRTGNLLLVGGSGITIDGLVISNSADAGVSSQWTTSGTSISYITGNVGIGLVNPAFLLDINGTSNIVGDLTLRSNLILSSLTTAGGLLYTNGSGMVAQTPAGVTGECLQTISAIPTWGECGSNFFMQSNGILAPLNSTLDFLIGGQSSASAKFAFLNNNSGIPTASVSGGLTGGVYLTAAGKLATTSLQTLTLGDSTTTGSLILNPSGNVGIGTLALANAKLTLNGGLRLTEIVDTTIGTAIKDNWNAGGNSFNYRRSITVSNSSSTSYLPSQEQVTLFLTGSAASQICGNSRSDANDIRVFYNTTEIARNVIRNCTTSISISFLTQAQIPASGSTNSYSLYYNNPTLSSQAPTYTYSGAPIVLDNGDIVSNWVSSDIPNLTLSQETVIKQEGTGSIKAIQSTQNLGNIGTFSTTNQGQLGTAANRAQTLTATIGGTTYFYVIGGIIGTGSATSSVQRAVLNGSGDVGALSTTNQGQLPDGRYAHRSIVVSINGSSYIYTTGGVSALSSTTTTTVYRAQIDGSGNIGTWSTTNQGQLPVTLQGHGLQSTIVNGTNYLYIIGGSLDASDVGRSSVVYKAQVDSSGNIGTWSAVGQTPLPLALTRHVTAVAYADGLPYLYVLGGFDGNTYQSIVYRALVDSGGDVGVWSATNQGQLPGARVWASANVGTYDGAQYLYVLGGVASSAQLTTVFRAPIGSTANLGAFSTTGQGQLPVGLQHHASTIASVAGASYIYVVGGQSAVQNFLTTIYKAPITNTTPYTATRTFSAKDLSTKGGLQIKVYSSLIGSYMNFEFSNDAGSTWVRRGVTVSSANTWETKTYDITGISGGNKSTVTKIRFNVIDPSTGFTAYFDDMNAVTSPSEAGIPLISSGLASLGTSDIMLNSQGTGAVRINFATGEVAGGSGGLSVYDGGTSQVFSIDGSGNASASGTLSAYGGISTQGNISANGTVSSTGNIFTSSNLFVSGNIGIGTSTPVHKLELANHTTAAGGIGFGTDVELYRSSSNTVSLGAGDTLNLNTSGQLTYAGITVLNTSRYLYTGNGLVGTPAYSFDTDPDIGMYRITTNTLGFATTGVERIRVDANGNVGIGATIPLGKFHVEGAATGKALAIFNELGDQSLFTASASGVTRFVVQNNGNVGIGITNPGAKLHVSTSVADYTAEFINTAGATTSKGIAITAGEAGFIGTGSFAEFFRTDSAAIGSITFSGGTTSYNTTSDRRVKDNITDTLKGLDEVMRIQVRDYTFTADPGAQVRTGFIAQELYDIYPDAVWAPKDPNQLWAVDLSKLTPLLIRGMQQQQKQIDTLSTKVQVYGVTSATDPSSLNSNSTLRFDIDNMKEMISSISGRFETLESMAVQAGSMSAMIDQLLRSPLVMGSEDSSESGIMNYEAGTSDSLIVGKSLNVLGRTTTTNLSVTGTFNAGLLSVNGLAGSIDAIGQPLKLQSLGVGSIDILNGKVTIDVDGNIQVVGKITAHEVEADKLSIPASSTNQSGVLSTSAGVVTISVGERTTQVQTTMYTTKSLIFTTPEFPVTIGSRRKNVNTFTIELAEPATKDTRINWWIIN